MEYYWYNGWGDKLRSVKMKLSEDEYQTEKYYYMNSYLIVNENLCVDPYIYSGTDKIYITDKELGENGIGFLTHLMERNNKEFYYHVLKEKYDGGNDMYWGRGVICNDELNELILYFFKIRDKSVLYEYFPEE